MRLGVLILPDRRWARNAERWRAVEQLKFDSAWTYDHMWWRSLCDDPWFSAMPVLAAAASVTQTVSIGLMVASPNFRHPVTLVKDAIALDDISEGRFILGVGSGAAKAGDAEVLGTAPLSAASRMDRYEEFVELTDRLLGAETTTYDGHWYSAREARMTPGSLRQPRVPLAVAASGPKGMALAARYADAWVTPGPADWTAGYSPDECLAAVVAQAEYLKRACDKAGRDFERLDRIFIATGMCGNPLR